jgi:hypothetical protein
MFEGDNEQVQVVQLRAVRGEADQRSDQYPALCGQGPREEGGGRPPGVRQGKCVLPPPFGNLKGTVSQDRYLAFDYMCG